MSETVHLLQNMVACECGKTEIKQSWSDAEREYSKTEATLRRLWGAPRSFCPSCDLYRWDLQPQAPFTLTESFPALLACGCGGNGTRIRQTFEDVLKVYPRFHTDPVKTESFCVTCNYVCWQALPHVPSITLSSGKLLNLEVKKSGEIITHKKGRIIERVED